MSERTDVAPVPEGEYFEANRFPRLSLLLAGVGVLSLGLCVVAAFVDRHQFSFSWLFAFAFFFFPSYFRACIRERSLSSSFCNCMYSALARSTISLFLLMRARSRGRAEPFGVAEVARTVSR